MRQQGLICTDGCLVCHLCVPVSAGYAFVFMKDSRDGDDAIRSLDGSVVACLFCKDYQHDLPIYAIVLSNTLQDGVWAAAASIESRVGKGTDAKFAS